MQGDDTGESASPLKFPATAAPTSPSMTRAEEGNGGVWNTRALPLRLGTDVVAAASAGVLAAPIITIIDR